MPRASLILMDYSFFYNQHKVIEYENDHNNIGNSNLINKY